MQFRKFPLTFLLSGLLILFILVQAPRVTAQCGSEASSCRDCHEVQGQSPVNNDGTGWHESHAFGDFCYICHAGNQQATDAEVAHESMEPPLADIEASCQACHSSDLDERAAVYATVLGVSLSGDAPIAEAQPTLATPLEETQPAPSADQMTEEQVLAVIDPANQSATACPAVDPEMFIDDPNLVDYAQRYNQVVLGEQPVNWGDVALAGAIGLLVLGGGGFVVLNELRLSRTHEPSVRVEGEYPPEVVELLPHLTNLNAESRKSLKRLLTNPKQSRKVLNLIDAVITDDESEE